MNDLIIAVVVGYMYKVQKNGLDMSDFHQEFAAIRHGDYYKFFNLIGKEVDFVLVYDNGKIDKGKKIDKNEIAFVALIKSAESMKDFFKRCTERYGLINDPNLNDEDFRRAATFEISLRIHANDKRLPAKEITLEKVIDSLEITDEEKGIFHKGRRFINDIKRPYKLKGSWSESLLGFNEAYQLMDKLDLRIK
jgi:hypothetical protein